jgi:hypothetical protein
MGQPFIYDFRRRVARLNILPQAFHSECRGTEAPERVPSSMTSPPARSHPFTDLNTSTATSVTTVRCFSRNFESCSDLIRPSKIALSDE